MADANSVTSALATLGGGGWTVTAPTPYVGGTLAPPYTWAGKPAATAVPVGTIIRITDFGVPFLMMMSDGTRWVPTGPEMLSRSAVPVILPSSGSSNATGQITLTTALPAQPTGTVGVFLPAGVVTAGSQGSGAGVYQATFSSTTVCQLTGTGIVTGNAAYTQAITEVTLVSVTTPGGVMGLNGGLEVWTNFSVANNVNNKIPRVKLGGTRFGQYAPASVVGAQWITKIRNRGSASVQISQGDNVAGVGNTNAPTIGAVDTSVDQALTITGQLAVATDYLILEFQEVRLSP